jgi:hypothetical protein
MSTLTDLDFLIQNYGNCKPNHKHMKCTECPLANEIYGIGCYPEKILKAAKKMKTEIIIQQAKLKYLQDLK